MKRVALVLLVFVLQTSAFGQAPPDKAAVDGEIRTQAERYFDALDKQDVKMLDDLLADECQLFYPRGLQKTKATLLKTLGKSGATDNSAPTKRTLSDVKVRRLGDTAIVTCQVTRKRGDEPGVTNQRTLTWALQDGRWRLLHDQWSFVGAAQSAEFWSDYFLGKNQNFNQKPNTLLMQAIEGRRPGKALDVGMGSGRNAIGLAKHGWKVTGIDRADGALAVARQQALEQGLTLVPVLQSAEEFDWGQTQWDLIAMLYFHAVRDNMTKVRESLKPGGLVVVEAFQAAPGTPGKGVMYKPGELRKLFADGFEILRYEETEDVADYADQKRKHLVRLVARKTAAQASAYCPPRRPHASSKGWGIPTGRCCFGR